MHFFPSASSVRINYCLLFINHKQHATLEVVGTLMTFPLPFYFLKYLILVFTWTFL